jgi:membrane-bound metal-dependent hydrolase YbcI (DUF457 family)
MTIVLLILIVLVLIWLGTRGRAPKHLGLFVMKCPHCRNLIPDRATICEFCHNPVERRSGWFRK